MPGEANTVSFPLRDASRASGLPSELNEDVVRKQSYEMTMSLRKRRSTLDVLWTKRDVSNVVRKRDILWQEEPPCVLKVSW